jgi:2,4-dienoyl-CoA reductase (NADPH2)
MVGDKREEIPADTVVLALGAKSDATLAEQTKDLGMDVIVIGDAKTPRKISDAILEGFQAGLEV